MKPAIGDESAPVLRPDVRARLVELFARAIVAELRAEGLPLLRDIATHVEAGSTTKRPAAVGTQRGVRSIDRTFQENGADNAEHTE